MDREDQFFEYANPHAWLLSAIDLRDQGALIYARRTTGDSVTRLNANGQAIHVLNRSDRAIYLLWGFAAENLLKAIQILRDPTLVGDGRLAKDLKNHRLDELGSVSSDILSNSARFKPMLTLLQSAIVSWARYPCGLHLDQCSEVRPISESFSSDFSEYFDAHANWLRKALEQGIYLPSGREYGRFVMSDDFLK